MPSAVKSVSSCLVVALTAYALCGKHFLQLPPVVRGDRLDRVCRRRSRPSETLPLRTELHRAAVRRTAAPVAGLAGCDADQDDGSKTRTRVRAPFRDCFRSRTATATVPGQPPHGALRIASLCRGGDTASLSTNAAASSNVLLNAVRFIEASRARCWALLFVSIFVETFATTMIKIARDSKSTRKLVVAYSLYLASISGFAVALENIDVGVAYAVWAALGTAVVSAYGILLFGETCSWIKISCLLMIVLGVVGLNLTDTH